MNPFAYGLRDHSFFREPFLIDARTMVQRATPKAFRPPVADATVAMLPLVRDVNRQWRAGWCTYPDGFENNPDIEVLCGGENEKKSDAAACWRQGNLFHFGFEQSPAEMNDAGQRLLLNAVAYISRFTEDRPIAVTPSVFAGPVTYPRTYLDRRLGTNGDLSDVTWLLSETTIAGLKSMTSDKVRQWFKAHRAFLHPGTDAKLEVDADALALDAPIDRLDFFDKTLAVMSGAGTNASRATRLLERYAPAEIGTEKSQAKWTRWLTENRPYLFFSDQGDYHWYVDPLAKQRGVPSNDLRGPSRASRR